MADIESPEPRFMLSRMSLDGSEPDVLGINLIRGWYGPGAWAAFFCFIVASWIRMYRDWTVRFEANTWILLLATNCAAIDLILNVAELKRAFGLGTGEEIVEQQLLVLGRLAAAMMVTYWGTLHALLQFSTIFYYSIVGTDSQAIKNVHIVRGLTIVIGLQVPATALCTVLSLYSVQVGEQQAAVLTPVFYLFERDDNWICYFAAGGLGAAILSLTLLRLIENLAVWLWRSNPILQRLVRRLVRPRILCSLMFGWGCLPQGFVLLILSSILIVSIQSVFYVVCGLRSPSQHWTRSCFFMPCTGHSILDLDQALGLVAGLIMLLGAEIIFPFVLRGVCRQRLQ